jgi:hypothetical protein
VAIYLADRSTILTNDSIETCARNGIVDSWGLFGIRVYARHEIYMFISTTEICQVQVGDG